MRLETLRNSKGLSLLPVLAAIAIFSIVSLSVFSIFNSQYDFLSKNLQKSQMSRLISRIRTEANDPLVCRSFFGHNMNLSIADGTEQNITINYNINNTPISLFPGAVIPEGGFTLDRITMKIVNSVQYLQNYQPDGVTPIYADRNLFLHFPNKGGVDEIWTEPLQKKKIEIRIIPKDILWNSNKPENIITLYANFRQMALTGGSGVYTGLYNLAFCHGIESYAEACELSGGTYDSTNVFSPIDLRCNPDLVCKNSIQGAFDCPTQGCTAPYVKMNLSNEKCICQWCNKNRKP